MNKTLADVRRERAQVETELLNIIEEREALMQVRFLVGRGGGGKACNEIV